MSILTNRNTSIDIGRFIASLLVVCLHTKFPITVIAPFISDLGKIAVPFFLMVSGFYLFSEDNEFVLNKTKKGIKKILSLILQAGIVYAILRIIKFYYFGIDISGQDFRLLPFLFVNDCNFTEHLWYLFAYLDVLIIIWVLYKFEYSKYLILSLPIFLIIHIVFSLWSRVAEYSSGWYELNWLVTGLPYVVLGMFVKKRYSSIREIDYRDLVIIIVLLFISIFIEHYAFKQFFGKGPGVISTLFITIACFILCVIDAPLIKGKIGVSISKFGRIHALNIYLYHILIRELINLYSESDFLNNSIIIFILSFFLSVAIEHIKNMFKIQKLRVRF